MTKKPRVIFLEPENCPGSQIAGAYPFARGIQ